MGHVHAALILKVNSEIRCALQNDNELYHLIKIHVSLISPLTETIVMANKILNMVVWCIKCGENFKTVIVMEMKGAKSHQCVSSRHSGKGGQSRVLGM